jgi:hypothetical protein
VSPLLFSQTFTVSDLVECKRDKPDSRQFCYVRDNSFNVGLKLPRTASFESRTFSISDPAQLGSFDLKLPDNKPGTIYLSGLEPLIQFKIDWSNHFECARNALWSHGIYAVLKTTTGKSLTLARINTGLNSYEKNLASFATSELSPWQINETENDVLLSAFISVADSDFVSGQPLPQERIPASCKMTIQDLSMTYDARGISKDLANLRTIVADKMNLLAQSSVIHANLIDSKNGATCSAYRLGKTVRDIEMLSESAAWDTLSLSSKNAVKAALTEAKTLGMFADISAENLWSNFIKEETQNELEDQCAASVVPNYTVSTDPFMSGAAVIHTQGYNNAVAFNREKENLRKVMEAAWALAEASSSALASSVGRDWLKEKGIYIYIDKDIQ